MFFFSFISVFALFYISPFLVFCSCEPTLPYLVKLRAQFNKDDRKTTNASALSVVFLSFFVESCLSFTKYAPTFPAVRSTELHFHLWLPKLNRLHLDVVLLRTKEMQPCISVRAGRPIRQAFHHISQYLSSETTALPGFA